MSSKCEAINYQGCPLTQVVLVSYWLDVFTLLSALRPHATPYLHISKNPILSAKAIKIIGLPVEE